ncbi:MAG: hypothetical protein CL666_12230 [Balneola sp.]|nr:hypothetical protein [Balneola sp.]
MDPIKIEKLFHKIIADIKRAGSERVQLFFIHEFILALQNKYRTYDSYLIQLFELFPALEHPLLFTGLKPEVLKVVIRDCEEVISEIPELNESNAKLLRKVDHLKAGLDQIHDWLGIDDEPREGSHIPSLKSSEEPGPENERNTGEVFIPVVEASGKFEAKGQLRKLKVEVVGESGSGHFELRPVFGVIGAQTGELGKKPAKAAGILLKEHIETPKLWKGTAQFEMTHTWHAGNSANVALSGLFYCEMLRAEKRREYFRLNPGIAITGDINEKGEVVEVDGPTLKQKVAAAFFSWAQVLVVPYQQFEQAEKYITRLNKAYPNRNLVLKGIGHLRELFFDRRLSLHTKTSLIEHTAQRLWKKKYSAVAVITIIVLLGIIGRLIYGPVDKNPVSVNFAGAYAVLENKSGLKVGSIHFGERDIDLINNTNSSIIDFYDISGDGLNEVIYAKKLGNYSEGSAVIEARSVTTDTTLWSTEFNFDIDFPKQQGMENLYFHVSELKITSDKKGVPKLMVMGDAGVSFPGILAKYDLLTGVLESYYLHVGDLGDMLLADIDEDGVDEVLMVGINNAYWMASLIILDLDSISGHSPTKGDYIPANSDVSSGQTYVLFPKTIVGQAFDQIYKYNSGRRVAHRKEKQIIAVEIFDTPRQNFMGVVSQGYLIYEFDYDLNIKSIISSDDYDVTARNLYEEGHIPFIPDYEYWEGFRDSVLVWGSGLGDL